MFLIVCAVALLATSCTRKCGHCNMRDKGTVGNTIVGGKQCFDNTTDYNNAKKQCLDNNNNPYMNISATWVDN